MGALRIYLTIAAGATSAAARGAEDPLAFRGSLSWISAWQSQSVDEGSSLNPGNQVLALPHDEVVSELRPNLKVVASQVQLIARPRVRVTYDQVKASAGGRDHERDGQGKATDRLNEAFCQWTVSDVVTFAYGLQSYQWGGTEVLSPSNRIFHETAQQRTVLYEVQGKNLARVNLSLGKQFSTVVMADVKAAEDEPAFVADQPFQPTGLVKSEYNWHDGADYVGLVAGGREHGHPWAGGYFNYALEFIDGLSVFADASAQRGSDAWYPTAHTQATPVGPQTVVVFAQDRMDDGKAYALAAYGMKYDFINGSVLRGEYVQNQAGYSTGEHALAMGSFAARNPAQLANAADNLRRFLAPGLELPGQRYAYGSLHVPDLLTVLDLVLESRLLYALADHSWSAYNSLDYKLGGSGTATVACVNAGGSATSELKGVSSPTYTLAYRHDW